MIIVTYVTPRISGKWEDIDDDDRFGSPREWTFLPPRYDDPQRQKGEERKNKEEEEVK